MSILVLALEYINDNMVEYGDETDQINAINSWIDSLVEYVISLTKSANSALVQLSGIRKHLLSSGCQKNVEVANHILSSPAYNDLKMKAREDANNNLADNIEVKDGVTNIGLTKLGDYKDILTVLNSIVYDLRSGTRDVNIYDLLYTIINFSGRSIDIFQMKFEDGYLSNWGKQRANGKAEYIGYLPVNDAAFLLDKVQEHYTKSNRNMSSIERDMRNASMKLFGVNPRDLRRISSIILSSTEKNRIKRIHKQQTILRHKSPLTSVLYYS